MKKVLFIILLLGLVYYFFFSSHKIITLNTATNQNPSATISNKSTMTISSSAFANNGSIPAKYTCDGPSINPPLSFGQVPSNAKSLVMLMDDHDVPKRFIPSGIFDHWVVYNIPPTVHEIEEHSVPQGVSQGLNGAGEEKYTGPCPPDREHRYHFRLYALDTNLEFSDPSKVTKQMVIDKMQGHIIEQAELIGRYNRPQN